MDDIRGSAVVLLLDLPQSSFCGIDLLSFSASDLFKGIKSLPSGWHFVFTGVNSLLSLRHGAWFFVEEQTSKEELPQVFVFKWSTQREELYREQGLSEVLRWRANLGSLWRNNLSPYRQSVGTKQNTEGASVEDRRDWPRLTDCITKGLVSKILGRNEQEHWTVNSAASASRDIDSIPGLSNEETDAFRQKDLNFLPVDLKQTWRQGAVGRERTEAAQDRSWALGQLIQSNCEEPANILGEFQFCFLMILTLNNNSCMEQWRRLLTLILTCKSAAIKQPTFFEHFFRCLRLHLQHSQDAEGGLFDLSDSEGSLLKPLLSRFRQGLDGFSGETKQDLIDELDDVDDYLQDQHGWFTNGSHVRRGLLELEDGERVDMDLNGADEEDESGEYAPTVVDLPPELGHEASQSATCSTSNNGGVANGKTENTESCDESEDDQDLDEMDSRF